MTRRLARMFLACNSDGDRKYWWLFLAPWPKLTIERMLFDTNHWNCYRIGSILLALGEDSRSGFKQTACPPIDDGREGKRIIGGHTNGRTIIDETSCRPAHRMHACELLPTLNFQETKIGKRYRYMNKAGCRIVFENVRGCTSAELILSLYCLTIQSLLLGLTWVVWTLRKKKLTGDGITTQQCTCTVVHQKVARKEPPKCRPVRIPHELRGTDG